MWRARKFNLIYISKSSGSKLSLIKNNFLWPNKKFVIYIRFLLKDQKQEIQMLERRLRNPRLVLGIIAFELYYYFKFIIIIFLFVVNFVIHWNETAMDLHVFPIPIPAPTSLSTRSL